MHKTLAALGFLAMLSAPLVGPAAADTYPSRTIRIIVAYAPGGSTDLVARVLAQELTPILGQSVVVENKGGGGTVIGTQLAARSAPDGYTLFYGTPAMVNSTLLHATAPYELTEFEPVSLVTAQTLAMFVAPKLNITTIKDFIAHAKANPGKVNFASSGNNSAQHLTGAAFMSAAGVDMVHIPYRGAGPALTDLLAGQVDVMFTSMFGVMEHVKRGDLRLLATTGLKRPPSAPEFPTLDESGLRGFEAVSWQGLLVPAKTPQPVIARLVAAMRELGASAALTEKLAAQGMELRATGPEELRVAMQKELESSKKAIAASGAKID